MLSAMRRAWCLVNSDALRFSNILLPSARSSVPPLVYQGTRTLASKPVSLSISRCQSSCVLSKLMFVSQVKGQSKTQKIQKAKAKQEKQEVEIKQGMTVAALAQAMNKDFGEVHLERAPPPVALL